MELTKEYFDQQLGNLSTKEDLEQFRDELRVIKTDISDIKQTVTKLDKRDIADSDAFARTLVKHDSRLKSIETEVKHLKLKQA